MNAKDDRTPALEGVSLEEAAAQILAREVIDIISADDVDAGEEEAIATSYTGNLDQDVGDEYAGELMYDSLHDLDKAAIIDRAIEVLKELWPAAAKELNARQ